MHPLHPKQTSYKRCYFLPPYLVYRRSFVHYHSIINISLNIPRSLILTRYLHVYSFISSSSRSSTFVNDRHIEMNRNEQAITIFEKSKRENEIDLLGILYRINRYEVLGRTYLARSRARHESRYEWTNGPFVFRSAKQRDKNRIQSPNVASSRSTRVITSATA